MAQAQRPAREDAGASSRSALAYVVLNPSKRGATPSLVGYLRSTLNEAGWQVRFLETTREHTGATQARQALSAGAGLVVAAGGDGTLRCVAGELGGSGVPMGIIPLGTANLAARALGVPVSARRVDQAVRMLVHGSPRPVDLPWVRTQALSPGGGRALSTGWASTGSGSRLSPEQWHPFLTVAGIGFDAQLVASTTGLAKRYLGWLAYAAGAAANLGAPRVRVSVCLDGTAVRTGWARTVLVANAGQLPAGIRPLPGARMDDGEMDVAQIDVRGGLLGWLSLAQQVLPPDPASYGRGRHAQVTLAHAQEVVVRSESPTPVQVDGDLLPATRVMRVRLDAGALQVVLGCP